MVLGAPSITTIRRSGGKTENCNRFLAPKNIGIEPPLAIVAHVTIFDFFWLKIAVLRAKGCGQNGSHDGLGVKLMVAIDSSPPKT